MGDNGNASRVCLTREIARVSSEHKIGTLSKSVQVNQPNQSLWVTYLNKLKLTQCSI